MSRKDYWLLTMLAVVAGLIGGSVTSWIIMGYPAFAEERSSERVVMMKSAIGNSEGEERRFSVTIDPRIELLSVVGVLADHKGLTNYDIRYKQEILNHFSEHRDHHAVTFLRGVMAWGLASDAYAFVVIHLSQPPALNFESPVNDEVLEGYLTRAFGGDNNIIAFVEGLRDFAKDSDFKDFFDSNHDFYQSLRSKTLDKLGNTDYVAVLEQYIGEKHGSYHIILGPLLHHGGFGPSIVRDEGVIDLFSIIGPAGENDGIPDFGDLARLQDVLWHEFAHSFVDPITTAHLERVEKYSALYAPIADQMARRGYTNWQTCVNEHIIRAITCRLFQSEIGPEAGERALEAERGKGFKYIDAIYSKLLVYEANRTTYGSLKSYYPEIVAAFGEIADEK